MRNETNGSFQVATEALKQIEVPEDPVAKVLLVKSFLVDNCKSMNKTELRNFALTTVKDHFGYPYKKDIKDIYEEALDIIKDEKRTQRAKSIAAKDRSNLDKWQGIDIPPEYTIEDDCVHLKVYNKDYDVSSKPICLSPCIVSSRGIESNTDIHWLEITFKDSYGNITKEWVLQKDALTKSGVMELTKKGLNLTEKNAHIITNYFSACLKLNEAYYEQDVVTRKNGWKDECDHFVFGNRVFYEDKVDDAHMLSQKALKGLKKAGTLKGWIEGIRPVITYPLVRMKCYGVCSAMIIRLLNVQSCIIDNNGESSEGKTISCKFAFSMLGDPNKLKFNGNSTQGAAEVLAEIYCDLAIFLDETGSQINAETMKTIIYTLANEGGKNRLNKDITLRETGEWKTIAFTTGEQPLLDNDSFSGLMVRVIELKGGLEPGIGELLKEADYKIKQNHGHIVDLYIKKIFEHKDELYEWFSDARKQFVNTGTNTGDRVADNFAAFTVAGRLLEEIFSEIGIDSIDPEDITTQYFEKCVSKSPVENYSIRALDHIIDWINTNISSFESARYDNGPRNKRYGWIGEDYYDIIPSELRYALSQSESKFKYKRVISDWYEAGILHTTKKNEFTTVQKKYVDGNPKSIRVVRLLQEEVQKYLGLGGEINN